MTPTAPPLPPVRVIVIVALPDLRKDFEGKVSYAAGYEPPELPEAPTETE